MNDRHRTRRPPRQPMGQSTWARIPMGDTGVVCWRIWQRDHLGAHQMRSVNVGTASVSRREIAKRLRKARAELLELVYGMAGA